MEITKFNTMGNVAQDIAIQYWNDQETNEILFAGGNFSGKAYLGCGLIIQDALLYPGTIYFIAMKTLAEIKRSLLLTFNEAMVNLTSGASCGKMNNRDSFFGFNNGSRVYFFGAPSMTADPLYARFNSLQVTRGFINKAHELDSEAIKSLSRCTGRWKNQEYGIAKKMIVCMTANKKQQWAYSVYLRHKGDELPSYLKYIFSGPENTTLNADYFTALKKTLTPNTYKRLIEGDWDIEPEEN